jgi:DUF971 family protein
MTPLEIRLQSTTRMLEVDWEDGSISRLAHLALRQACRCAECVRVRRSGRQVAVPDGIELLEVMPYGPNAVQLRFSDGHERGIFPFPYLRELECSPSSV